MPSVPTKPIPGQKPGTSGLRKRVKVFEEPHYLANFVQATLNAIAPARLAGSTLVVGGDGRYFLETAIQIIARISAANGVKKLIIGQNGILSTPAVSAIIRRRVVEDPALIGAFILTASHNPGGPDADFGIKFNAENGGPAPESLTNAIYNNTLSITEYLESNTLGNVDIATIGSRVQDGVSIEIVDSTNDYVELMKSIFDFDHLRAFVKKNPNFTALFDSMNGVTGPYIRRIMIDELGFPASSAMNTTPLPDFGGEHPDPNLTYAKALVDRVEAEGISFGAAFDGDGDRNMIVGKGTFVNPSDSVAMIAANADVIPYFRKNGVLGLARSMPTSGALDLVAKKRGLALYEVPTGWKFFGNLMDANKLSICGEESFGTGSNHIREKDGIWAALAWLSIVASGADLAPRFLGDIQAAHFSEFGRNYFSRYDYEEVDAKGANEMMARLQQLIATKELVGSVHVANGESFTVRLNDDFEYVDPVDASVSSKQGVRVIFEDGSRIIVRLSGTGSVGATVRLYVEKYEADRSKADQDPQKALGALVSVALTLTKLKEYTGRDEPTVIT